eukprot:TRINITY_DN6270_c0_g1_i1.p1 TRINITY_DN6270_c0_g1~~TRINITY_DN6270_c0_g1_i1.p1  ORF type:complete len:2016 (-),score=529.84 TRINITY_DN6270_c0_g1_i1:990-6662(-)
MARRESSCSSPPAAAEVNPGSPLAALRQLTRSTTMRTFSNVCNSERGARGTRPANYGSGGLRAVEQDAGGRRAYLQHCPPTFSVVRVAGEQSVHPARYFGVDLKDLRRDLLTLTGVPLLVDRALKFLHHYYISENSREGKVSSQEIKSWSVEQVENWLDANGFSCFTEAFRAANVDGAKLGTLTAADVDTLVARPRHVTRVLEALEVLTGRMYFADAVLGGVYGDRELKLVLQLVNICESEDPDFFRPFHHSPLAVCSVLKLYFTSLPEALIPKDYRDMFLKAANVYKMKSLASSVEGLRAVADEIMPLYESLPDINRNTLQRVLDFLQELTCHPNSILQGKIEGVCDSFVASLFHPKDITEEQLCSILLAAMVAFHRAVQALPTNDLCNPVDLLYGETILYYYDKVQCLFGSCHTKSVWLNGTVFLTNYRVIWRHDLPPACLDLTAAERVHVEAPIETLSRVQLAKEPATVIRVVAKHFFTAVLSFVSVQEVNHFLEDLGKTLQATRFPYLNKELYFLPLNKAESLGWHFFSDEIEFGRMIAPSAPPGGLKAASGFRVVPGQALFPGHVDVIVSPRVCIVPDFFADMPPHQSLQAVPVLSWYNAENKSFLLRSTHVQHDKRTQLAQQKKPPVVQTDLLGKYTREAKLRVAFLVETGDKAPSSLLPDTVFVPLESESSMLKALESLHRQFEGFCSTTEWERQWATAEAAWLRNLKNALLASLAIANFVQQGQSMHLRSLVEGASNVCLISSLVCLLMDPFYRTARGFVTLVEKEWVAHGYQFAWGEESSVALASPAPVNASSSQLSQSSVQSPVIPPGMPQVSHTCGAPIFGDAVAVAGCWPVAFVQFIDCVWQLWRLFPAHFGFNEQFLEFLLLQTASYRFGTFVYNLFDSGTAKCINETPSLWAFLNTNTALWANPLYAQAGEDAFKSLLAVGYQEFRNIVPQIWPKFFLMWKDLYHLREYQDRFPPRDAPPPAKLDLSHCQLNNFPPYSLPRFYLVNLTELDISSNNVTTIPSYIFQMTSLTQLNLSNNSLQLLPSSVLALMGRALPQLASLDVSCNKLELLPDNVSCLTQLRAFSIANNDFLTTLKPLQFLTNLNTLVLNNALQHQHEFPTELVVLTQLRKLYLSNNSLAVVPEPAIAAWAHNLQLLDLSYNKLKFQSQFTSLANLQTLNLSHNEVDVIPLKIVVMTQLVQLYLSHNKLKEVTPALGLLRNLEVLVLSHNPKHTLPPTIGLLSKLKEFAANEGALPEHLRNTAERLGYLYVQLNTSQPAYRGKLFCVGQENVGKTVLLQCLAKRFKKHATNLKSISTDGIDVFRWTFQSRKVEQAHQASVAVWDFAGQGIHTSTHQIFLTDRAVYLLVWKVTSSLESSRVYYWLNNITTRAKNPVAVFIVGTHIDKEKEGITSKLEQKCASLDLAKNFPMLHIYYHFVSNVTKDGLKKLRAAVKKALLEQMGGPVPRSYFLLEHQIKFVQHLCPPIIRRKDWELMAKCCSIMGEEELDKATEFLHNLGSICCFLQHAELRDFVVTVPEWLPKIMSSIVTEKHKWARAGILQVSALKHIWKELPATLHATILHLLEKFHVAFVLDAPGSAELTRSSSATSCSSGGCSSSATSTSSASSTGSCPPTAAATPTATPPLCSVGIPRSASRTAGPGSTMLDAEPMQFRCSKSEDNLQCLSDGTGEESEEDHSTDYYQPEPLLHKEDYPDDTLILIPALLPLDPPTALETMWPATHSVDEVEIGRQFKFLFIPDGLFCRVMVSLFRTFKLLTFWRDGFTFNVHSDNCLPMRGRLDQNQELNTISIKLRLVTKGRTSDYLRAGEVMQMLLETIGAQIRDWFKVSVTTCIMCSECLKHGRDKVHLFSVEMCERAVLENTAELTGYTSPCSVYKR